MAIFIPHIKGCEENGNIYTWIKWQGYFSDGSSLKYFFPPEIEMRDITDTNTTTNTSLGNIITSNAQNQEIKQPIAISCIESTEIKIDSWTELNLYGATKTYLQAGKSDDTSISLITTTDTNNKTTRAITYKAEEHNFSSGYVIIGDGGNATKEVNSLYIQNSCNALYFNATSDVRAKTKVQHASFKALNIVKSLPVYTFNYKETGSPAIGLLAQDAAKISFGSDFSLVNNPTASGENGDYMTIKESKLIYILWKAIQEQQEQIKYLTSLVEDLSRK